MMGCILGKTKFSCCPSVPTDHDPSSPSPRREFGPSGGELRIPRPVQPGAYSNHKRRSVRRKVQELCRKHQQQVRLPPLMTIEERDEFSSSAGPSTTGIKFIDNTSSQLESDHSDLKNENDVSESVDVIYTEPEEVPDIMEQGRSSSVSFATPNENEIQSPNGKEKKRDDEKLAKEEGASTHEESPHDDEADGNVSHSILSGTVVPVTLGSQSTKASIPEVSTSVASASQSGVSKRSTSSSSILNVTFKRARNFVSKGKWSSLSSSTKSISAPAAK